ncbi:hypothetical protein N7513_008230 [Penicillium frequentans]|nr:hypothetical protein N7513_008230 [Penicillium glabrum]
MGIITKLKRSVRSKNTNRSQDGTVLWPGARLRTTSRASSFSAPSSAGRSSEIIEAPPEHSNSPLAATQISVSSHKGDPWAWAYEMLAERQPALMADYKKHLGSIGNDSPIDVDFTVPRSIESVVKKLQDQHKKKQWQVALQGKQMKIREPIEKMIKFVIWAAPIIQQAVSNEPHIALAWGGVCLVLPLLSSSITNNEAMLKGFNLIGEIQIYWDICEKRNLESKHQEEYKALREPLAKLYSQIIEYQARAICHLSKAQLSRAWENVAGAHDWEEMTTKIGDASNACTTYLTPLEAEEIRKNRDSTLQEIRGSREILGEIREILEKGQNMTSKLQADQQQNALLQDLASQYEDDKEVIPLRVQDTCEWFFEDQSFRNWRDSDTSCLLRITAGPGCGKSVLSRTLIDENRLSITPATSTVCYFFFNDGDESRTLATNALSAILHQLLIQDSTGALIGVAVDSHKKFGVALRKNFSELWRLLNRCASLPEAGEVVCVLDALDECNENSARQLIDALRDYYSQSKSHLTSKLKFLITSRPYAHLEASFKKSPESVAYLRFDGDEKSVEIAKDIDRVIDYKLKGITGAFNAQDRERISERLKAMENRTYLWLHLTFHIIEENPSQYGRRSDVEALLEDLPEQLSSAYEKILARSKSPARTEALLRILLAAMEPLTLDEANMALTTVLAKQNSQPVLVSDMWGPEVFRDIVKDLCGLLVNIHGSKLFFMHQTTREFLAHRERQGEWKGRLDMLGSHRQMLMVCLTSLSCLDQKALGEIYTQSEFFWGELMGYGAFSAHNSHILQKFKADFPLALYSTRHWIDHARPTEKQALEDIVSFVGSNHAYEAWDGLYCMITSGRLGLRGFKHQTTPPLLHASSANLPFLVKQLLENGANINAEGYQNPTALYAAAEKGHKEIVELLLRNNADVNARSCPDTPPAFYDSALFPNSASATSQNFLPVGKTALYIASSQGHEEIVQLLLDNGADVTMGRGKNEYPIHAASQGRHIGVVKLLLKNGADASPEGDFTVNGTPLFIASEAGFKDLAEMLIEGGANVNKLSGAFGRRMTALMVACTRNHFDMVELLLEKGANVNIQGTHFALHSACETSNLDIVQLLVRQGADVNFRREYGNSLAYTCSLEVAQFLIDNGADVNAKGDISNALVNASEKDHLDIVRILIENGADVNAKGMKDEHGNALFKASSEGNYEVVQLLLESGADADSEEPPLNALQAARKAGWDDVAALLLQHGARRRLK